MSKIAVSSPASGTATYTISAPAGSTDRTITLPDATGTVLLSGNPISGTTGTFSGAVQASGVATNLYPLVSGTAVASTSGTSIDFTDIPSWVKRVTVMFNGVSTNGTSPIIVRLAASGSVQTTGYTGTMFQAQQSQTCVITTLSSGFNIVDATGALATQTMYGTMTLNLVSSNDFMATGLFGSPLATERMYSLAGYKSLGASLDRVRITTVNGTDTFDAGSINIMYE